MKNVLKVLLPLLILTLGVLAARALVQMRPEVERESATPHRPAVEVLEARAELLTLGVEAQGSVTPRTESQLVSEVSGSVLEVSPSWVNGGFFEAGEVLLSIDSTDYLLAEREADMRVAKAELMLAQEKADATMAREDWELERGAEPLPALVAREPQLAESKAALAAAQSAREQAQRDFERCQVIAPYPGRVRAKNVDRGGFVQRGTSLGTIYAVDYAEVRVPLADADLAFLDLPLAYRSGPEAAGAGAWPAVRLEAEFGGQVFEWSGRVTRTEGELDPKSRMLMVVVQVDDPYGQSELEDRPPLAIGMFVSVHIEGRQVADVMALPRTALRGRDRVYLLQEDGTLHIQQVEVLRTERERVLIQGGLEVGAQVIVSPLDLVVEGMQVRAQEARSL